MATILSTTLLLTATLMVTCQASCCDKNLIQDLSFKISGTNLHFPCNSTKNIYTTTGLYIPKNIIATRMQIYKNHAILACPRLRCGVPCPLVKFNLKSKQCKPQLEPFPCWSIQEEGNCDSIQNAIDLFLDSYQQIWVLDLGICNTLMEQPIRRCMPKIWCLNVETGEVVKTISLQSFVTPESRLQYLIVDYSSDGQAFAYVADAGCGALIVINLSQGNGYRLILPNAIHARCASKDILYLQLACKSCGNVLYLTYLHSPRLFSIKTEHLQKGQTNGAIVDCGAKPKGTSIVFLGSDNGSALFMRFKGESDIYVWNSETCFKQENFILVQKGGDCRLATQVVPGYKQLMWGIESNFHDYVSGCTGCLGASMAVYPLVKTD